MLMSHTAFLKNVNQLSTFNTVETPHKNVNFWLLLESRKDVGPHSCPVAKGLDLRSSCPLPANLPVCHRPHHSLLHLLLQAACEFPCIILLIFWFCFICVYIYVCVYMYTYIYYCMYLHIHIYFLTYICPICL